MERSKPCTPHQYPWHPPGTPPDVQESEHPAHARTTRAARRQTSCSPANTSGEAPSQNEHNVAPPYSVPALIFGSPEHLGWKLHRLGAQSSVGQRSHLRLNLIGLALPGYPAGSLLLSCDWAGAGSAIDHRSCRAGSADGIGETELQWLGSATTRTAAGRMRPPSIGSTCGPQP